ncbi:hypothetical protein RZR70_23925, partial [Escherichia coli]|uniref:hypothetical protein n=1 Tax=Escherichia coli TaxID=562 RepID=UPI00292B468A
ADRNRSHWSTSKTPSYTKSVSWQHHPLPELLPDTYLRDASLATITPKRPIIVLRASGMFTMYAGI